MNSLDRARLHVDNPRLSKIFNAIWTWARMIDPTFEFWVTSTNPYLENLELVRVEAFVLGDLREGRNPAVNPLTDRATVRRYAPPLDVHCRPDEKEAAVFEENFRRTVAALLGMEVEA